MTETHLDKLIKAWDLENNNIPPEESTLAARLEILTIRALAEGRPLSAERLAATADVPVELTEALNGVIRKGAKLLHARAKAAHGLGGVHA